MQAALERRQRRAVVDDDLEARGAGGRGALDGVRDEALLGLTLLLQQLLGLSRTQLPLLDALHQLRGLRPTQQAPHVALPRAVADVADLDAPPEALRALRKLVLVLHPLPVQRPPLAGAATHVA